MSIKSLAQSGRPILAKLKEELKHDDKTNKIVRARGSGKGLSLDAGAGPLS